MKPEDLTPDQQAMVMWLYFIEKFNKLSAKQKIVYLCGFCESIDHDLAKEAKNMNEQEQSASNPWADAEVVSVYSRRDALEDGVLPTKADLAVVERKEK